MALIKCPECGKEISDKALTCPNCGNPIAPVPPAVNLNAPVQSTPTTSTPPAGYSANSSAPQVGIDTQKLKCPYCGETLGPQNILSSGWAKCPTCGESIKLTGANGEYDDNVLIERILPFSMTKDEAHKFFMSLIMNSAGTNVFETMRVVSLKRMYVWVREFGRANDRVIYPLCQFGKDLFKKMQKNPWMPKDFYEHLFPTEQMVPFNSEDIRDTEMLAKEMSAAEVKLEFSHTEIGNLDPTPNYYCLPVVEEVVEYEGKKYTFIGTAGCDHLWSDQDLPMESMPEPKYTQMKPVTIALWSIIGLIFLIIIIELFAESFWLGIIISVILAVVGFVLQGIFVALFWAISAIPMGIDKLICKAINTKRRKKIRQEYAELQEAKKQSAKKRLNVELEYDVPEFPIP